MPVTGQAKPKINVPTCGFRWDTVMLSTIAYLGVIGGRNQFGAPKSFTRRRRATRHASASRPLRQNATLRTAALVTQVSCHGKHGKHLVTCEGQRSLRQLCRRLPLSCCVRYYQCSSRDLCNNFQADCCLHSYDLGFSSDMFSLRNTWDYSDIDCRLADSAVTPNSSRESQLVLR